VSRLKATFERLRATGELGVLPYLTTGFPDPETTARLLDSIAAAGADAIELGVPFSDPLADGATLQRVGAVALEQGASIGMALDLLKGFRARWQTPVVLMSYYNPILAYGESALMRDGAAAGLDGLIVPDLPLEEASELQALCAANDLDLVCMLAPTSTPERVSRTAQLAGGFIYCVALVGVTGARTELADELPEFLRRVRQDCRQPLVVGFGISTPAHVQAVRGQADGVIVASALADLIERTPAEQRESSVGTYVADLKAASKTRLTPAGPS
jgi:tryptophan synthase alpha chain